MHKRVFPVALFIVASAAGFFGGVYYAEKDRRTAVPHEIREPGHVFINPLLECEGSLESIGDRELRPFHKRIQAVVQKAIAEGMISQASVYFRDLNNGPWFGINAEDHFSPASLLKVPVMLAYLKRAERDPLLLKKRVRFEGRSAVQQAPGGLERGREYAVDELILRMIAHSDNDAKDLLIRNMDRQQLDKVYTDLIGQPPPSSDTEDFLSVREYASFFRILFNASYLDRNMSERALSILSRTEFREGLAAGVPGEVRIAHKYGDRTLAGSEARQLHDCGIIYYPNNPYLLCIMTRGKELGRLSDVIKEISWRVYTEIDVQEKHMPGKQ